MFSLKSIRVKMYSNNFEYIYNVIVPIQLFRLKFASFISRRTINVSLGMCSMFDGQKSADPMNI